MTVYMSGPKLSEYELEQIRKAELERIQREKSNSQTNIRRLQQQAKDGVKWCDQQLLLIDRQLKLLSSSTISANKASNVEQAIVLQRQKVLDLKTARTNFQPSHAAQSDSLQEIQAEENRLRNLLESLNAQESVISDGSAEYIEALSLLADNIKGSLTCSTYSLAEAMQSVTKKVSIDSVLNDEADKMRSEMLNRIAALKCHKLATKKMIDRLENAAHIAEQESNIFRLKELDSMVIKEVSRNLNGLEAQFDSYQSARCENLALKNALGKKVDETEEVFDTPDSMKKRMAQLIEENTQLYKCVIDAVEKAEIEKSIDIAMCSLGYQLIGTKSKTVENSVKLYEFADGVGIQLTQRNDGIIRMKVVGIGSTEKAPDEADKIHLVKMQEEFCGVYDSIVEALANQGICQIKGTEHKLPPNVQFAQVVNVLEYDSEFFEKRQIKMSAKNRTEVQKPIHLTTGE